MRNLLLALVLLLLGCNTLPVGSDQLGRTPGSDSLFLSPDTAASYGKYVPLGSADTMILGRDDQYESRILIRFEAPDTAIDSIVSMKLVLYPADSAPMRFTCRPCSTSWNANAASWKLADSLAHWLTPGGDFWDIELCTGKLEGESLVVDLDVDHAETFLDRSYGLALIPLDTGFVAVHSGFSLATSPALVLKYSSSDEEFRFQSNEDAHIVDTNNVTIGFQDLTVGSGFAFRTFLRFSLDSIPEEATIARAELSFLPEVDYRRRDTLGIGIHRLSEPYERNGRNAEFYAATSGRLAYVVSPDTDSVAVIDVRALVQYWTTHPDSNFGLYITAQPEWTWPFRMRIPRSGEDSPRLDVLYTMPPQDRFW